jgi:simple sugar transport system permease protein
VTYLAASGGFFEVWIIGLFAATLRYATPLTLAALGGLFSERSGVVNIALEGLMLAGAFFAIWGSVTFHSWVAGLLCAILAGAGLAALHAMACINFNADQIISGTAIILLAQGLVNYLNISIYGAAGTPAEVSRVPVLHLGILDDYSLLIPLTIGLIFLPSFVVFRTPFGLHLRSVGAHPRAADTVGITVTRMRWTGVLISGCFGGLAGAYLSFDVGSYTEGMSAGKGFIALAALIFGKWMPWGAFAASLLFGFSQALGDRLQSYGIPPEIVTSLPYVVTVIALAGFVGKSVGPAAVGKPYVKG